MLDVLLVRALEEIGLEGGHGASPETLWGLLDARPGLPFTPMDENVKRYLYGVLQTRPELSFHMMAANTPSTPSSSSSSSTPTSTPKTGRKKSSNTVAPFVPPPAVPASSVAYGTAEYTRLRMILDRKHREVILGIKDMVANIGEVHFTALEEIGKTRGHGLTQKQLSDTLRIDARNLFHFVKTLECMGLVMRLTAAEGHKIMASKLLVLTRYAPSADVSDPASAAAGMDEVLDDLKVPRRMVVELCEALDRAKDKTLPDIDCAAMLGVDNRKVWRKFRQRIEEGGYIQVGINRGTIMIWEGTLLFIWGRG
eukprot:TRINITY_DN7812_c0_g1_i3.p1 TRINITY_DN7812_c0_g1~~TRINITY_DN7812_c0_g1_i3.p1  ORF type:complete len:311 (+),score=71.41 TRINITY_DN7812_c0_g1_i3:160-1092(+)